MKTLIVLLILVGCNNIPNSNYKVKQANKQGKIENFRNIDTSILGQRISQLEFDKLELLKKKNRKEYARVILKQYAFCNCIYQSFSENTEFKNEDISTGILIRDFIIHDRSVVDSIDDTVSEFLLPTNTVIDSSHTFKNQSFRCLNLYISDFLDSLVKKYDNKILPDDY